MVSHLLTHLLVLLFMMSDKMGEGVKGAGRLPFLETPTSCWTGDVQMPGLRVIDGAAPPRCFHPGSLWCVCCQVSVL